MHHDSQAAIIANDLDSMVHRIEAMPADVNYTRALNLVQEARAAINAGRSEIHQRETRERYAAA